MEPERCGGAAFFAAEETCVYCCSDAFQAGFGPDTFIQCEACLNLGAHVGCLQREEGRTLTEAAVASPSFQYFCSEVRAGAGKGA